MSDISSDIYEMMDRAGLDSATLMRAQPLSKIVNNIRTKLHNEIRDYILERDEQKTNEGEEE